MDKSLAEFAKAHGVKYFLINFTDLSGVQRSKLVPAAAIDEMQSAGAGFAGFAAYLDMTPAYPDMFGVPDAASVVQLPWRPEVAWVASDLMIEGAPVAQAPRVVLKNLLARAEAAGYRLKTGVEAEYMLLSADGAALSDPYDTAAKPCYDQQALMRRYDVIAEICDAMGALGWGPYQNDHE
ncbi:MAG: type III glutamate--ammonia ligase, partial [Pseudomonadota bacterium]|nr:type III glutamate--ammonia ligase [Pseudomonadota bacterium]MEC8852494.1 type III glutamate--ammonia ligase [Pseudomonadota bacterium]